MKKYFIKKIRAYGSYTLEDEMGKTYKRGFEFFNIEPPPSEGEYIYLSEKLFDLNATEGLRFFRFGELSSVCGRTVKEKEIAKANAFMNSHCTYNGEISEELFAIERNNERIFLKQLYG